MVKRKVFAAFAALLLGMVLVACGGESAPTDSTSAAPPPQTTNSDAADDEAAKQAQEQPERKAAQDAVDALEQQVKAVPTLDEKLSLIVTQYCQIQSNPTTTHEHQSQLLERLYDKYWQAGGKWNQPLQSAAMQDGGCPGLFPTIHYPEPDAG